MGRMEGLRDPKVTFDVCVVISSLKMYSRSIAYCFYQQVKIATKANPFKTGEAGCLHFFYYFKCMHVHSMATCRCNFLVPMNRHKSMLLSQFCHRKLHLQGY